MSVPDLKREWPCLSTCRRCSPTIKKLPKTKFLNLQMTSTKPASFSISAVPPPNLFLSTSLKWTRTITSLLSISLLKHPCSAANLTKLYQKNRLQLIKKNLPKRINFCKWPRCTTQRTKKKRNPDSINKSSTGSNTSRTALSSGNISWPQPKVRCRKLCMETLFYQITCRIWTRLVLHFTRINWWKWASDLVKTSLYSLLKAPSTVGSQRTRNTSTRKTKGTSTTSFSTKTISGSNTTPKSTCSISALTASKINSTKGKIEFFTDPTKRISLIPMLSYTLGHINFLCSIFLVFMLFLFCWFNINYLPT